MTIASAVVLVLLGLALWAFAGLLPVARIVRSEDNSVAVQIVTTWMGTVRIAARAVDCVDRVRFADHPATSTRQRIEVHTDMGWRSLDIRFTRDATALAQFVSLLQQYLKVGGPRVLALPLRGRMRMMSRFMLAFPAGTVSIFAGILMITSLGS